METIPRLETERLRLRAIFPKDRQGLFELFADPEVVRFYDFPPLQRMEDADEMIRRFIRWFQNRPFWPAGFGFNTGPKT